MKPEPGPTNTTNLSDSHLADTKSEELQHEAISEPTISPCEHMENNISALSDNTLHGLPSWFTQLHASYCPKCGPALRSLKRLRIRLGLLKEMPVISTEAVVLTNSPADISSASSSEDKLTEARKAALEQAMKAVDVTFNSTSTE